MSEGTKATPRAAATPEQVLFLCTGNSARSQMAEGLLRHLSRGRMQAYSAGTQPGRLRQEAVAVMAELGIDISRHWSKGIPELGDRRFDLVVTVCDHAAKTCPRFPGAVRHLHWSIPDPVTLDDFRSARDQLHVRIEDLLRQRAADET